MKLKMKKTWIIKGVYFVQSRQLVVQDKPLQSDVKIKLSPAFVKFITKNSQKAHQEENILAIIKVLEKKAL